ncbi:MAG: GTPase/DUF3482 domain-containing protein [Desulfuromonadaceae bacterium]|nr:GTPase/DUF3482 domain-containing protein [Desulfuromonadaceae bacterium]
MIPEFAIMGHPNEGKSSVLSTLAEDDSVRVSDTPGETRTCRSFPVTIDGKELLRFTDTPGFQNPARVLAELSSRMPTQSDPLRSFREFAAQIPELHDDRELLAPLTQGAGIIYVVDGSRPVRHVDRMEMEILRLTGKPRMAIINNKENESRYLEDWKLEFRKNFNSSRTFNAHRATYAERIHLLEALKSIDQDWQQVLGEVVEAIKKDWSARNKTSATIITSLLKDALSLSVLQEIGDASQLTEKREKLLKRYNSKLGTLEKQAHQKLRNLYKHNIFDYQLPPHSLLHTEILDERSWQLLGMTKTQIALVGTLGGAAAGLGLDAATMGLSFGVFTALGGALGGLGAIWGSDNLAGERKFLGIPLPSLGGEQLQLGPAQNINLLFVLLNRSFLYYQHTINWAHGRRDYQPPTESRDEKDSGFTRSWSSANMQICQKLFRAVQKNGATHAEEEKMRELILETLDKISKSEG